MYSCAIEDPENDTIILTGGFVSLNSSSSNLVARYGKNGFIEYLPKLKNSRYLHGCAGYYNNKKELVRCFSNYVQRYFKFFFVGSFGFWWKGL